MEINEILRQKAYEAYNNDLVGKTIFDEDEYRELFLYTQQAARNVKYGVSSYMYGDDKIHFVTLVEMAKRWKASANSDDQGFWDYICSTLNKNNDGLNPKQYKCFQDIIAQREKFKKMSKVVHKKYYALTMMHAFAPYASVSAFFDFVYNIFKNDLDYGYVETDKFICEIATQIFRSKIEGEGGFRETEDVTIGSSAYGIKIGLRSLVLMDGTEQIFENLLDEALVAIDSLYYGKDIESSNYFLKLIREWWIAKADKEIGNKREGGTVVSPQTITLKFIRKDGKICLRIPRIRFDINESIIDLTVNIRTDANSAPLISKDIDIRFGEITKTSEQCDIPVSDFLNGEIRFHIEIMNNGISMFEKQIYKEFILFDDTNEKTNKILKSGNYFLFSTNIDSLKIHGDIERIGWNLYSIYVEDGDSIIGKTKQALFLDNVGNLSGEKVGLLGKKGNLTWSAGDICYSVYTTAYLYIPKGYNIKGIELWFDEKRILLSTLFPMSDENDNLVYDMSECLIAAKGYKFSVYYNSTEKYILNENLIYLPNLKVKFDKDLYYGEDEIKLTIYNKKSNKSFVLPQGKEKVSFKLFGEILSIDVPIFKWRIDCKEWQYKPINDIVWYKSLLSEGSVVEFSGNVHVGNMEVYALLNGAPIDISEYGGSKKYCIGRIAYANENLLRIAFLVKICDPKLSQNFSLPLFEVSTSEHFTVVHPVVEENGHAKFIGTENFIGDPTKTFKLEFKRKAHETFIVDSDKLIDGVIDDLSDGRYFLTISRSGGLFTKRDKHLWEGEFVLGNPPLDMTLKIQPIYGMPKDNGWEMLVSGYYLTELVRDEDDEDIYIAKLYKKESNGNMTTVAGFSKCKIFVTSPSALELFVDNGQGYLAKLKCDKDLVLYGPNSAKPFSVTSYYYIEVKNV